MQAASWYSKPPGKVRCRFTTVLAAERQRMIDQKWNSERCIVFSRVVLTKTLSTCKVREIRARIDCRLGLWGRERYAGLVGGALSEGRAKEGCFERHEEEEEDSLACSFHSTFLWGYL